MSNEIDIAKLRKLLAGEEAHRFNPELYRELVHALPGLLDEVERLQVARCDFPEDFRAVDFRQEVIATLDSDRERIAQLEAALREISIKGDADAAEIADAALAK